MLANPTKKNNIADEPFGESSDYEETASSENAESDESPSASDPSQDKFWAQSTVIDSSLWNAKLPYQLLILDEWNRVEWQFTLPIAPQELNLSMPMAITPSATFGGIVEEHNGAPFRNIILSGTTGVNLKRGSAKSIKSYSEVGSSIRTSISETSYIYNSFLERVERPEENSQWLNIQPDEKYKPGNGYDNLDLAQSTGYYQFRLLQRFLERYINLKKRKDGTKYRLAFAMWKDEAMYLVTPLQFEVKRSATSPLEYTYSLQLRAWKRILISTTGQKDHHLPEFSAGYMQRKLEQAQKPKNFFDEAMAFYRSKQRSYNEAMNAISKAQDISRQVVGYLKVALNTALFISDLSPELLLKLGEEEAMRWARLFGYEPSLITKSKKLMDKLAGTSPVDLVSVGVHNATSLSTKQGGLSTVSGASTEIDSLELSPTLLALIEKEKQSYQTLTRSDFESMRNELMAAMAEFSASVGLSTNNQTANESVTQTINSTSSAVTVEPTENDYQTLFEMNRLAMVLNSMAVSADVNLQQITPMDYVAGLATQSSIAFKVARSKFGVPFPYGYTLEQLARDYLQDPNRWMEIATLNGLQAPYVDEVGVEVPLVVNGAERTLVVELPADATIARGQAITVAATGVPREKRYVQEVERRGDVTIIRLDGESDLDKFTVNGQAAVHFYRPNTVNSQMMIYIPSDSEPTEQDYATKSIPGLANLQQMIAVGGVDLQLTNSMDLAVTPDGDCKLAIGLTNLIQRVRIAFSTPPGGLLQHPEFGLGLIAGTSTADLTAKAVMNRAQSYFRSDSAFSGIQSVLINKDGPSLAISLSLGVRGVDQLLPVTLEVKQ